MAESLPYGRICEEHRGLRSGDEQGIRRNQYSCAFRLLVWRAKTTARCAGGSSLCDDHAWSRRAPQLCDAQGGQKRPRRLFPLEEPRVAASVSYADLPLVLQDRRSMHCDKQGGTALSSIALQFASGPSVARAEWCWTGILPRAVLLWRNCDQTALRWNVDRPQGDLLSGEGFRKSSPSYP